MGNPKFIPTQKKVTYSFRIEEDRLEKVKQISNLNDIKLPQLMSNIIGDYLTNKTVYNNYLEDIEGMFIDLPDITQGRSYDEFMGGDYFVSNITLEYEVKKIPNNLDVWDSNLKTYKASSKKYLHEGVEFLIVPELCEFKDRCFTDLTQYLYCVYFTVKDNNEVDIDYISFIDAVNKLNKCENFSLLNHALKIKETLEERSETINGQIFMMTQNGNEFSEFEYVWGELKYLSKTFNSGNIIPMNESREDIEYKAKVKQMSPPDVENILKENEKMKKELKSIQTKLKSFDSVLERLDELEKNREKKWDIVSDEE